MIRSVSQVVRTILALRTMMSLIVTFQMSLVATRQRRLVAAIRIRSLFASRHGMFVRSFTACAVHLATALRVCMQPDREFVPLPEGHHNLGDHCLKTKRHRSPVCLLSSLSNLQIPLISLAAVPADQLLETGVCLVVWSCSNAKGPYHHSQGMFLSSHLQPVSTWPWLLA